MRLHEIDWNCGREYHLEVDILNKMNVVVHNCRLKITSGNLEGNYVDDVFHTYAMINANFTPISQPVTFLEAYQDCLVNTAEYETITTSKGEIKATIRGYGTGDVVFDSSFKNQPYNLNCFKWAKVVK